MLVAMIADHIQELKITIDSVLLIIVPPIKLSVLMEHANFAHMVKFLTVTTEHVMTQLHKWLVLFKLTIVLIGNHWSQMEHANRAQLLQEHKEVAHTVQLMLVNLMKSLLILEGAKFVVQDPDQMKLEPLVKVVTLMLELPSLQLYHLVLVDR